VDLNIDTYEFSSTDTVSLREKGVDLNFHNQPHKYALSVSLREKGVDLNIKANITDPFVNGSPFVRREWI